MQLPKHMKFIREGVYQYRNPVYISQKKNALTLKISDHGSLEKIISHVNNLNILYAKEKTESKKTKIKESANNVFNFSSLETRFSEVAKNEFAHWKNTPTKSKDELPVEETVKQRAYYTKIIVEYFKDERIERIGIAECSQFLSQLDCTDGTYRLIRYVLISIFTFAISTGAYKKANPVRDTIAKKKKRGDKLPMQIDQYNAIYALAPEWMQIAMTIALETSLRSGDVRQLKWEDIIERDGELLLVVKPEKKKKKATDKVILSTKKLAFKLKEKPRLAAAINRAKALRDDANKKREAMRDCPYIVANYSPEKLIVGSKHKTHSLQITKSVMSHTMEDVRKEVLETTNLFSFDGINYSKEQLPAWHGVRKLSLFLLSQEHGEEAARQRAGHHDIDTTIRFYLQTVGDQFKDVTYSESKQ